MLAMNNLVNLPPYRRRQQIPDTAGDYQTTRCHIPEDCNFITSAVNPTLYPNPNE